MACRGDNHCRLRLGFSSSREELLPQPDRPQVRFPHRSIPYLNAVERQRIIVELEWTNFLKRMVDGVMLRASLQIQNVNGFLRCCL